MKFHRILFILSVALLFVFPKSGKGQILMCSGTSNTNQLTGQLYDSGGPSGNYQLDETCSLLIAPTCAGSVTLTFSQFNVENGYDFFTVYDGIDSNAPLLINATGTTIPSPITATSGKMFITWYSDGFMVKSGWNATWSTILGNTNPPIAAFSVNTNNPPLNIPIIFTDSTNNIPLNWYWDFGDGQSSTLQNPSHSYTASGNYNIVLIAGNCVTTDTISHLISVQPAPVIYVNPDSISSTLFCNDSIIIPLTIYNSGSGNLVFDLNKSGSGDTSVLVIRNNPPFWFDFIPFFETNYGITPVEISTSQIAITDFSLFDVIIIVAGQNSNYYNAISSNAIKFETFAVTGGKVEYLLLTGSGIPDVTLAGGTVMHRDNVAAQSIGLIPNHPILLGTTNPLLESPSNRNYLINVPYGATIITASDSTLIPTTVEYNYGKGTIIATVMGWEKDYISNDLNTELLLPNSLSYFFSKINILTTRSTLSTNSDTIAPGDSITINVTIYSNDLIAGDYNTDIEINSNDPLNPSLSIPLHINNVGPAIINLSDTCLNFGSTTQYTTASDTLKISNSGCDSLFVTSITSTNSAFHTDTNTIAIAPNSFEFLIVHFSPQTVGSYSGNLILLNNGRDTLICLTGVATPPPVINLNPTTVNVNVTSCNDTVIVPVYIVNNGNDTLIWNLNDSLRVLSMNQGVDSAIEYTNTIAAINQYFKRYKLTTTQTTDTTVLQTLLQNVDVLLFPKQNYGDLFYYTDIRNTIVDFVTSGGTVIVCGSEDVCLFRIYEMGIFNGYTAFIINNNNTIPDTTLQIVEGLPPISPAYSNTLPQNINNPDRVSAVKNGIFDVVAYRDIGSGKGIFVGWDYEFSDTLTQKVLSNAVRYSKSNSYPNWFSIGQSSGIVAPGDSELVYLTVHSDGLSGGNYPYNLLIYNNDPLHSIDTLTVTMNVSNEPCADFSYQLLNTCNGNVSFRDTSINMPTSWLWDFGDSTQSTLQYPVHTYSYPGIFKVKLLVCNSTSCDSITKDVIIITVMGHFPVSCIPHTIAYCCGSGITQVVFNTINNISPDGIEGYRNYSCRNNTVVKAGYSYPIHVATQPDETVRAWIDYNSDGSFNNTNEKVLSSTGFTTDHTAIVTIPNNAVINTTLRMRIASDFSTSPTPAPCTNVEYGQFEDYAIIIIPDTLPPIANFTKVVTNPCFGIVTFTDVSGYNPTSWSWAFGDGDSASVKNPVHQYANPGTYLITLIVTSPYGTDSISKNVTVNPLIASFTTSGSLTAGQVVQFNATAPNLSNFLWSFGDSTTSTLQSPQHIFQNPGIYFVNVAVTTGGCTILLYDTITILPVGLNEPEDGNTFKVYPNPFNQELQINYNLKRSYSVSLKIVDMIGQTIQQFETCTIQQSGEYRYTFRPKTAGIYFIQLTLDNKTYILKVAKVN